MAASIKKDNFLPSQEEPKKTTEATTLNEINNNSTNESRVNEKYPNRKGKNLKSNFESDRFSYDKALKTAVGILSHADNTKKQLREKLHVKGFKKDIVDLVIEYLCEKGYINESEYLCRAVEYYANTKLFGKRRIYIELLRKGFDKIIIEENFENCTNNVDFINNCAMLIEKQSNFDKKKLVNSLIRYGYSVDEIREALKKYEENNDK